MFLRKQITGFVMVVLLALPLLFSVAYLIKQKTVQADMRSRLEKYWLMENCLISGHMKEKAAVLNLRVCLTRRKRS